MVVDVEVAVAPVAVPPKSSATIYQEEQRDNWQVNSPLSSLVGVSGFSLTGRSLWSEGFSVTFEGFAVEVMLGNSVVEA